MANVRRWEKQGLVYVRGYKTEERETPFREGYLVTWLDQGKPREAALVEAVERTEKALAGVSAGSPLMEWVMRVRDVVVEHSRLRRLVGFMYLHEKLGCTPDQAERAVARALQLYPSLRGVKLFDAYRYYHHESLAGEELSAAVEMKRSYLRIAKGRANRVGHNWEAAAEWFIDRFTSGARFWTQSHREGGMDPRRINVHLLRGVGGRRRSAELDRVWEVTPGVFAPPVTYVLSCRWGLVSKKHVDDFLEVLRWSRDFGVDTTEGRENKQGVVGVFAAGAFDPREHVEVRGERITLPQYAGRRNLQIITASDFNGKLRERGCDSTISVQKLCRAAGDEGEVRETLDLLWRRFSWNKFIIISNIGLLVANAVVAVLYVFAYKVLYQNQYVGIPGDALAAMAAGLTLFWFVTMLPFVLLVTPPLIKAAVNAFPSLAHPDLVEALGRKIPGRELGVSMLGPGAVLLVIALSVSFTGLGAWMAGNPTFGATTKSIIEVLCYVCGAVLSALGLYFLRGEA
jgi:hypothetical protein